MDVSGSCQFSAEDSQPKSIGLVWGLGATRRSVCIHQMNRVGLNSCNGFGHDDSIIIIIIIALYAKGVGCPSAIADTCFYLSSVV